MDTYLSSPTLAVYAVTCLVLCINLLFLWGYSGAVRGKTKTAINPEDHTAFGAALKELDPPEVARVLRAHTNAQAAIVPFLFLGLVFVLLGGSATFAKIVFGIFTLARVLHSIVYLAAKQPWRTILFIVAGIATLVLMGDIVWLIIQGPGH